GCFGYCPVYPSYYPPIGSNPYYWDGGAGQSAVAEVGPEYKASSSKEEPTYQGMSLSNWIATLQNPYSQIRAKAAAALGRMGPAAKDAVPALVEALKDKQAEVRVQASLALAAIGDAAVQPLIKALKDEHRQTRMGAALCLGHMGSKAEAAAPALKEA